MLGELWGGHRNYHRGLELTLEAVRTAEIAGNRQALAVALIRTGLMQLNLAQMSGSCRNLERALTIFQDLDDQPGCAKTLDLLAMADGIVGQIGRAIARNRDALRRYHALGDRMAPPSAITNMGVWLASAGKRREAEPFLREGLRTAIDLGARGDEAYACGITGWLLEIYGEYGPALRESTTALKLARQIGHLEWTAIALSVLGRITRICGQATRARQLHEDMLSITRELGTVIWIAVALAELGEDLIALGDDTRGFDLLVEAVSTAGEATEFVVRPLMAQAEWLLRQRRPEEALDVARQAKGAAGGYRVWAIEALKLEGEALVVIGRAEAGERLLRDAKAEARILTAAPPMWRAALSLADYLTRRGRFDEASAERADALAALESVAAGLPDDLAASFADSLPMHRASGTI
jgi:tetratricopeptide (TPR) repeat protein